MIPPVIDSHAHLYLEEFAKDLTEVLERARAGGITSVVNIGIDPATSRAAIELARREKDLFATAGLHPSTPVADLPAALAEIRGLALAEPAWVKAIGEIGLDFYWKDVRPEDQEARLRSQLDLALELGLPVVIHCRDALPDLFRVLDSLPARPPGVFHCFAGDAADARRAQSLGFHVSFAGNVTYKKAGALREAAQAVAPDRILLETDSPYLPPEGRRGKRNEPLFGLITRDVLAALHGLAPAELGRIAAGNTRRLFRLPAGD
jgi:TatD DNase family protein